VEGAALGVLSGGATGWIAVRFADIHGDAHLWIIAGVAAFAATLGYRYGRGVVAATFLSLIQGS
jgi:hypothetical protein